MSESDEPFEVVHWKAVGESFDIRKALTEAAKKIGAPVQTVLIEDFFRDLTQERTWHGKEELADVERYRNLKKVIQRHLSSPNVFRVGQTEVDIFIVGRTKEGDWTGVKTKAVET